MSEDELEDALRRTNEAVGLIYSAFAATVRQRAKYKSAFPMIAEQSASLIFKLRKEIDDMIGLTDYVAEYGVPPTDDEIDAMAMPSTVPLLHANGAAAAHHPTPT